MNHNPRLHHNVEKLIDVLESVVSGREVVDVCLYSGIPEPRHNHAEDQKRFDNQQGFFTAMKTKHGYRAFTKRTKLQTVKCRNCGNTWTQPKHKGIDVALATDLMLYGMANQFDVAIIVSGDSDFATVVNKLRNRIPSLKIEVAQFDYVLGDELKEAASRVYKLDDYVDDFCEEI